uniref:Uncharacterized protein n=1 Tax=Arundo donax TaxID=35708 RepID=A0A0A9GCS8_ARUDO
MKQARPIGWPTGHHCQRSPAIAWRALSSNLHRLLQMARSRHLAIAGATTICVQ